MSRPKTSLDYLIENERLYQTSDEYVHKRNPYITAFVQSGLADRIAALTQTDEAVHKLMNHRKLRKELTESYGAIVLLEKSVRRMSQTTPRQQQQSHKQQDQDQDQDHEKGAEESQQENCSSLLSFSALHRANAAASSLSSSSTPLIFVDVCSGKGITSFLLALLFPSARVMMLDFNKNINRDHLQHPACSNISFQLMDIYTAAFEEYLVNMTLSESPPSSQLRCSSSSSSSPKTTPRTCISPPPLCLLLGTHLCGHLSTRVANVFSSPSCSAFSVLILSPCCMPHKKKNKKENSGKQELKRVQKQQQQQQQQEGVEAPYQTPSSTDKAHITLASLSASPVVNNSKQRSQEQELQSFLPPSSTNTTTTTSTATIDSTTTDTKSIKTTTATTTTTTTTTTTSAGTTATNATNWPLAPAGAAQTQLRLRRQANPWWDPYMHWCLAVLLLLPTPALQRDLRRDEYVLSEKDIFISAIRSDLALD